MFCRKGVLRNFAKFTGKHLRQSLSFSKVAGLRPTTLLKKRLRHRCFPVDFPVDLLYRTPPVAASETSKQGECLLRGNYFHKKLHLRCMKKVVNTLLPSKPKKTIKSCEAETNHMANFKATYISVLNHWKTFETTFTTESNERNKITYLQS